MTHKQRRIHNFPQEYPWYKRFFAQIIYFFASTFTSSPNKRISSSDRAIIRDTIEAGDIILVGGKKGLSSFVIGGFFTHNALYLGDNLVTHAPQPDGVRTDPLDAIFNHYNVFALMRPHYLEKTKQQVITDAEALIGTPYDYEFANDPEKLYCTEYLKYVFLKSNIKLDIFESDKILYPSTFLESKDLEVIFITEHLEEDTK